MLRGIVREFGRHIKDTWNIARTGESARIIKDHKGTERKVIIYSREKLNQIAVENFNREMQTKPLSSPPFKPTKE